MNKNKVPDGFFFFGKHVGIKKRKKDMGIVVSDTLCSAAAMFTKNQFCGESVTVGKEIIADSHLQAIAVTSGIANVATGIEGRQNTMKIINSVAEAFSIDANNILPSSTGVIGPQLPVEKIVKGIKELDPKSYGEAEDFASAIMTTDTKIKIRTENIGKVKIIGIAKGSGMIEPNMATMLVYIFTDAAISSDTIHPMLKLSVEKSFNSISIDTDTSTSDTVVLMASNRYPVNLNDFQNALDDTCMALAFDILKDAEGATKLIAVEVTGCENPAHAKLVAKSIVNSPLVKTAVYGADPNWGRIIMAIGKVQGVRFAKEDVQIKFGGITIFSDEKCLLDELEMKKISIYMKETEIVEISLVLGEGDYSSKVYGCDLTEDYVRINSLYSS